MFAGQVVSTNPGFLVVIFDKNGSIDKGLVFKANFRKTHELSAAAASTSWTNVRKNSPETIPEDLSNHLLGSLIEDEEKNGRARKSACKRLGRLSKRRALDDFESSQSSLCR